MIVYHGSQINISEGYLQPHKAFDSQDKTAKVYVTKDYITALLYSINPIKAYFNNNNIIAEAGAFSAHIDFSANPITVYELYEGMFDELFAHKTYIYVCDDSQVELKSTTSAINENYVEEPLKIDDIEICDDLFDKLQILHAAGKIRLVRWNEWDYLDRYLWFVHNVETRATYCKSQEEVEFFDKKLNVAGKIKHKGLNYGS